MKNEARRKTVLKIACAAGSLLLLIFGGLCVGTSIFSRNSVFKTERNEGPSNFYQKLRLFDDVLALSGASPNHSHIGNLLEELDKSASGAEARLLFLKRYRKLARNYPEYREDYRAAAFNAAEKFPHSAVLAALSVEAGIAAGVPPAPEKLEQTALLLSENGPLSEAALLPVAFCLYALSGALDDMNSAASVKRVDSLYAAFAESLRGTDKPAHTEVRESMLVDAALIDVANHNLEGAAAMLSRLEPRRAARSKTLDFMANYSYDFLNPLLAAELWSRLGGEKDLANAASALYVAGESEKARNLWLLLAKEANASSGDNAYGRAEAADKLKILYNLALTAENESEKSFFLEQLLADTDYVSENREEIIAALIMYTRLQSPERARAMLLEQPFGEQEALLDLEQLDRSLETLPPELAAADTWLVLNRHSKTPELYRWAAWYFEYQRRYDELDALRRFAAKHQMEDPYLDFHEALGLIRTERSNEGAALLENIEGVPAWQRFANIALVYEARREYATALHSYEMAVAEISRESGQRLRAAAGRIYLRMARIRRVLGESPERVRRDLERAYELDSENINIRLALRNASG